MLSMRCRVLHNELLEGQQEQRAADAAAQLLQAELARCQAVEQAALTRYAAMLLLRLFDAVSQLQKLMLSILGGWFAHHGAFTLSPTRELDQFHQSAVTLLACGLCDPYFNLGLLHGAVLLLQSRCMRCRCAGCSRRKLLQQQPQVQC